MHTRLREITDTLVELPRIGVAGRRPGPVALRADGQPRDVGHVVLDVEP
jgi:hypothetical protein